MQIHVFSDNFVLLKNLVAWPLLKPSLVTVGTSAIRGARSRSYLEFIFALEIKKITTEKLSDLLFYCPRKKFSNLYGTWSALEVAVKNLLHHTDKLLENILIKPILKHKDH